MVARQDPAPGINLLDLKPVRLVESERSAEDRAVLLRPKFAWGPLRKLLQPRLKRPFYKVHLDEIGTFVWDRIDGATTVGQMADAALAHFGEKIEPVHGRLATFIHQLEKGAFIKIPR
jgi:hypothetical protein